MITPGFVIDGVRINEESLRNIPSNNRIQAIKYLRYVSGLGLKEAKELVEKAPTVLKEKVKYEEAEGIKAKLEAE